MRVNLMKNLRWHVFWALDFLKGRPVRKYYNQVKSCYINGTSTEYTQTKIRQLIKHAVKTTRQQSFIKPLIKTLLSVNYLL